MKFNKIIRYDDVGLPPNEFGGNTAQFLAGIKTNRTIQAFIIPLGIWFALPMNSFIGVLIPDYLSYVHKWTRNTITIS